MVRKEIDVNKPLTDAQIAMLQALADRPDGNVRTGLQGFLYYITPHLRRPWRTQAARCLCRRLQGLAHRTGICMRGAHCSA